jgi:hypothetical protein
MRPRDACGQELLLRGSRASSAAAERIVFLADEVLELRTADRVPLPDEDVAFNEHNFGMPGQAVVARVDLVGGAVVIEGREVDATNRCPVGNVRFGVGAVCHGGQYLRQDEALAPI